MSGIFTLASFAAHLHQIDRDLKVTNEAIVARACAMVAAEAKRVLGTYDYNWTPLAASTLEKKKADTPLLETGAMRASIEWIAHDLQGLVGSNSDIAVWQELGTSKIPPRPFLQGAAQHVEPKIQKMAAKAVRAVMAGQGLHSAEMRELIHLLKHIGHAAK